MRLFDRDIHGVILDLDGTIIDSLWMWSKIDEDFLSKRNLKVPLDYFQKIAAMNMDHAAAYTIERFGLNESKKSIINEWHEMALSYYKNIIKIKPGVKQFLLKLKENDVKITLATASEQEMYESVLKNNDIYGLFDYFVTVSEVNKNKNYPDIYELALKKMGLNKNDCIVFEDIGAALETAAKASFITCGVKDLFSNYELEKIMKFSTYYIESFEDILEVKQNEY